MASKLGPADAVDGVDEVDGVDGVDGVHGVGRQNIGGDTPAFRPVGISPDPEQFNETWPGNKWPPVFPIQNVRVIPASLHEIFNTRPVAAGPIPRFPRRTSARGDRGPGRIR